MSKEKDEELERLRNGDFSAGVDIDKWFVGHKYDYIQAAIRGCDKTVDFEKFSFILMYVLYYLEHPNIEVYDRKKLSKIIVETGMYPDDIDYMSYVELVEYWTKRIADEYGVIIKLATSVGSHHYDVYGPILEKLYTSKNDIVRLYCAANLNYLAFVNDANKKVAKVANIRKEFEHDFSLSEEKKREAIEFIVSLLNNNVIQYKEVGYVGYLDSDRMTAEFKSCLFTQPVSLSNFDYDVFYTISDKRVLASEIYRLIGEGKIVLNTEMLSTILGEDDSKSMVKDRKAEGYKFFN